MLEWLRKLVRAIADPVVTDGAPYTPQKRWYVVMHTLRMPQPGIMGSRGVTTSCAGHWTRAGAEWEVRWLQGHMPAIPSTKVTYEIKRSSEWQRERLPR